MSKQLDYNIMIMAFQAVCLIIKGSDNQAQEVNNQSMTPRILDSIPRARATPGRPVPLVCAPRGHPALSASGSEGAPPAWDTHRHEAEAIR